MFEEWRERRRNHHLDSAVRIQASAAADIIFERLVQSGEPLTRFNAQRPPDGLTADEFSLRTGQTAVDLASSETTIPVHYDHRASRQASTERTVAQQARQLSARAADVILIFTRPDPPIPH
ncbi:MAG TPA: hypothetical protein VK712_00060 [Verrucomicrobiae bacterium]|jgi:hypothetical protein|nr:hypothetical protein [Verrucomicrobiae bacterium]